MTCRTVSRRGFSLVELLVVIAVIGALVALILPALQSARETARRAMCGSHLRQVLLALHQYAEANDLLPSGCVVEPTYPGAGQHNAWREAESGRQGTSWMLAVLGFAEQIRLAQAWDYQTNVAGNRAIAGIDVPLFYCPSRRNGIREEDHDHIFLGMEGGGNDYGGCLGRTNGFVNTCSAGQGCGHRFTVSHTLYGAEGERIGPLSPNSRTRFRDIADGAGHTILIGEVQRLSPSPDATDYDACNRSSDDGWAVGGAATLFDTAEPHEDDDAGSPGGLNNGFFESAGSEHPGGAAFGMADGSLRFIHNGIDPLLYARLGSMCDGDAIALPE
jgi:prepilin-type N-terminal cleavage/methylation domain-containing protein